MHKLHIRLMTAEGDLIGWTEVHGVARGDGQLWVTEAVTVVPETAGPLAVISVHWVDVNVEIRTELPPVPTAIGAAVVICAAGPLFRVGPAASGLPPVTVRAPVTIGVPPASIGAAAPVDPAALLQGPHDPR